MKIEPLLFQQFCRLEKHIKALFSDEPGQPQYPTWSAHAYGSFPVGFQKEPVISEQKFARISTGKACQIADICFHIGPYEKSVMNLILERAVRGIDVTGPGRKTERNPGQLGGNPGGCGRPVSPWRMNVLNTRLLKQSRKSESAKKRPEIFTGLLQATPPSEWDQSKK
jgi:hypothetical protein